MKQIFSLTRVARVALLEALVFLALLALALPASAQRGFDVFGIPRTAILAAPLNLTAASNAVTNGPVDIRVLDGIARIDLFTHTNTGNSGGTLTATLYGSTDTTNLTLLSSFAFINSTTAVNYTNYYFGQGTNSFTVTNKWLLPGTIVTPTPATAGFQTKYLNPATVPFTNAAAITVTPPAQYEIGFNAGDALRYLYIVWTPGGTFTNFTVGALVTGYGHDTMIGW